MCVAHTFTIILEAWINSGRQPIVKSYCMCYCIGSDYEFTQCKNCRGDGDSSDDLLPREDTGSAIYEDVWMGMWPHTRIAYYEK